MLYQETKDIITLKEYITVRFISIQNDNIYITLICFWNYFDNEDNRS